MNWIGAAYAALKGLLAAIKARRAAKAGSELVDGQEQVRATDKDVSAIEAELRKAREAAVK